MAFQINRWEGTKNLGAFGKFFGGSGLKKTAMILEIYAILNVCQSEPLNMKKVEKRKDVCAFGVACISHINFVPHFNCFVCVWEETVFHLLSMCSCFGAFFHREIKKGTHML